MLEERVRVELEVRRPDDGDRIGPGRGGVRDERDRVRGRLRAAVHRDLKPFLRGSDEELGRPLALVDREENAFARGAEREDAVEAALDEEVEIRAECVLVERRARLAKGRECGCQRARDHRATLRARATMRAVSPDSR
jgi:hypothetical protein